MQQPLHPESIVRRYSEAQATDNLCQRLRANDVELCAWAYLPDTDVVLSGLAGPLAGIPFGVKDVINVAGMPTRCGSSSSDERAVLFDAACVSLLRRAGAIPVGKTATAEYAFREPAATRNPHNLRHTPGGSSSGSAAAVAAGMVPFALGTQTGGSIIRPAAYCGVIGFKPSFGAVSRQGLQLTCDSLDVIGWFANSIELTKSVASVLLPYATQSFRPARTVTFIRRTCDERLSDESLSALTNVCLKLKERGIEVREIDELPCANELATIHKVIMEFEIARSLLPVADLLPEGLSESLLTVLDSGLRVPQHAYVAARNAQHRLRYSWGKIAGEGVDLIIAPSAAGSAPQGLSYTGSSGFNRQWSALGWPCLHLPTECDQAGMPLGVQLIAPYQHDAFLLEVACSWHRLFSDS